LTTVSLIQEAENAILEEEDRASTLLKQADYHRELLAVYDRCIASGKAPIFSEAFPAVKLCFKQEGVEAKEYQPSVSTKSLGDLFRFADRQRVPLPRMLFTAPKEAVSGGKPQPFNAATILELKRKDKMPCDSALAWRQLLVSWNNAFTDDIVKYKDVRSQSLSPPADIVMHREESATEAALRRENAELKVQIKSLQASIDALTVSVAALTAQGARHQAESRQLSPPKSQMRPGEGAPVTVEPIKAPVVVEEGKSVPEPVKGKRAEVPPPKPTAVDPKKEKTPLKVENRPRSEGIPKDLLNRARVANGQPVINDLSVLTKEGRAELIKRAALPAWIIRGLREHGEGFLTALSKKEVDGKSFSVWSRDHKPSGASGRALAIKEWSAVKGKYKGIPLVPNGKTARERRYFSAYQKLQAKFNKAGINDVLPKLAKPVRRRDSQAKSLNTVSSPVGSPLGTPTVITPPMDGTMALLKQFAEIFKSLK
jgi:hypothetical protein